MNWTSWKCRGPLNSVIVLCLCLLIHASPVYSAEDELTEEDIEVIENLDFLEILEILEEDSQWEAEDSDRSE